MTIQRQVRQKTSTLVALAVTLQRPSGTAVDVSALTVKFKMLDSQGNTKIAETADNVTVTSASAGQCHYTFQDEDVDTEGTYYAYFVTYNGSEQLDIFPAEDGALQVIIGRGY